MEETGGDRGDALRASILSEIQEQGSIPFVRWMESCLYHPEFGYYQAEARIGKEGDYFTSPCVSPVFGYLVAKQLAQMQEFLGGEVFDVLEMGGGRGFLCNDVLHWAQENRPSFYQKLRYFLIETSPHFLKDQKTRLAREEQQGKVFWIPPERFWTEDDRFEGCFVSNELIDAFPVHRVMLEQGVLKELYITHRDGRFEETWQRPSSPELSSYFEWMGIGLHESQRAEVNLHALDWMRKAAQALTRGFVLTIDYGALAEELYSPYRMEGTLRSYFRHRISENPLERPGEQDITCHVNFTALIRKGEESGLRLTGFVPQYRFLLGLGFLQEVERMERGLSELDALKMRLSLKHLIEPERGMGEVFKVLVQHKGVENPDLDGLKELRSTK